MHTTSAALLALVLLGSAASAELACAGLEEGEACAATAQSLLQRAQAPRAVAEAMAAEVEELPNDVHRRRVRTTWYSQRDKERMASAAKWFAVGNRGAWGALAQTPKDLVREPWGNYGHSYGVMGIGDNYGLIGGGPGYKKSAWTLWNLFGRKRSVRSVAELEGALAEARDGDFIAVERDLDLGDRSLSIGKAVTLSGGRGKKEGSSYYRKGALLSFSGGGRRTFISAHAKVRLTGLRIRGPWRGDLEHLDVEKVKRQHKSIGVHLYQPSEVENCELFSWSHAAVMVDHAEGKTEVQHCHIHDTSANGYGYGVTSRKGVFRVEWSQFERNRHAVASTGGSSNAWEVGNNYIFGPNLHSALDMHGPHGNYFQMWNNWVESEWFFQVRGEVLNMSAVVVTKNWFAGAGDDIYLAPRAGYAGYRGPAHCNMYGSKPKRVCSREGGRQR